MKVPKQSECDVFFGNPRGRNGEVNMTWKGLNITRITPPFTLKYESKKISSISIHRKCAQAALNALNDIWIASGKDQAKCDEWGISTFGGAFNYRLMRGFNRLSMHAYGCAIDFAPGRFPMGQSRKKFCNEVISAFEKQGGIFLKNDPMHVQFATVG
jgi:hypothetical protein